MYEYIYKYKFKEDEESIGKTGSMPQPQWEESFDLEVDETKQVKMFSAFYKMNEENNKSEI